MQPSIAPPPVKVSSAPQKPEPTNAGPSPERPKSDHPLWMIATHTVPALLIIATYWSAHTLVGSMLSEEVLQRWRTGAFMIGAIHGTVLVLALRSWREREPVPMALVFASMVVHVLVSLYALFSMDELMPRSVPQWMFPQELFRLSMALPLVPALHCMFMIARASIRRNDNAWRTLMMVVLIPAAWYLMFMVMGYSMFSGKETAMVIAGLFMTALIYHLVKLSLQLARRTTQRWNVTGLIWRIVLGLVLPITGLIVHASIGFEDRGPLGDFSHPLFFILALINGTVLCLPTPKRRDLAQLKFFFSGVGLTYVLYFTLAFLPYLPFAILLIVFFGMGLLMLVPLVLLIFQFREVISEAQRLKEMGIGASKWAWFIAGVLIIPAGLETAFQHDALVLEKALTHLHAPQNIAQDELPSSGAMKRVTAAARSHKNRSVRGFDVNGTPFISPWYEQIVFKGLTLSDDKISTLEKVFVGHSKDQQSRWTRTIPPATGSVTLHAIRVKNDLDPGTGTWSAWVDLELVNGDRNQAEYATTFKLPAGAFIRDHYLMIGDRRAQGILAERKAASWIYRQITHVMRQDPSLLRYLAPGLLEFRVFPFAQNETRTTGFKIMTREPFELNIDGMTAWIGDPGTEARAEVVLMDDPAALFVPAKAKAALPLITPARELWCIIDRSVNSVGYTDVMIQRLEEALTTLPEGTKLRFMLVGTTATEIAAEGWQRTVRATEPEGGCFLDPAVDLVVDHYVADRSTLPAMLVITEHPQNVIRTERIPYTLGAYGLGDALFMPDPWTDELARIIASVGPAAMRRWPATGPIEALLTADDAPSMTLLKEADDAPINGSDEWSTGLRLNARKAFHSVEPERLLHDDHADARMSMAAGILTPATAYICLETEAQELALLRKQEEMLRGSPLMDAGEELRSMSEPGDLFLVMILLFAILHFWRRYRYHRLFIGS